MNGREQQPSPQQAEQQHRSPPKRQDSARRVTFAEAAPAVAPPLPSPGGAGGAGAGVGPSHYVDHSSSSSDGSDGGGGGGGGAAPGWYARFQRAVRGLKREVLALYYATHDARTPWASKLLPWLALAYALSPLDLVPDFIPVLGFVDDMLLLPALLWLAFKLIPPEIMADARQRARDEPLLLHRNWAAATLIFALWTAGLVLCAHWGFQRWADEDALPYEWAVLAGTAGVCAIAFVTWMVTSLQHERRRRDEWNSLLNASLLPGGGGGV